MAVHPIPSPPGATLSPDGLYWWDGTRWVPRADSTPARLPSGVTRAGDAPVAATVATGALLAAIGAFLPWATASTFGITLNRSGIDGGDGWFTVVGAALALLVAVRFNSGGKVVAARVLGFLAAGVIAVVSGVDMSDIDSKLAGVNDSGLAVAQLGAGIYLTFVGAAIVAIGVLLSWRRLPD